MPLYTHISRSWYTIVSLCLRNRVEIQTFVARFLFLLILTTCCWIKYIFWATRWDPQKVKVQKKKLGVGFFSSCLSCDVAKKNEDSRTGNNFDSVQYVGEPLSAADKLHKVLPVLMKRMIRYIVVMWHKVVSRSSLQTQSYTSLCDPYILLQKKDILSYQYECFKRNSP